jgi:hypothetical protein
LRTKTLILKGPDWHYGGHRSEARAMAHDIVRFLSELKEKDVDRTQSPRIAEFTARRTELSREHSLGLHTQFNRNLGDEVIRKAVREGIDIAIVGGRMTTDNSLMAYRDRKFEPSSRRLEGISARLKDFLKMENLVEDQQEPDFLLRTTLDFTGPETPDFQAKTRSYKKLTHGVELVFSEEPVTYLYYNYSS